MIEHETQSGDIVAEREVDGEKREYSYQPVFMQPTDDRRMAAAGLPWVRIGYEMCHRAKGKLQWRRTGLPRVNSMREAITQVAQDLDFPDESLLRRRAVEIRRGIRLDEESVVADGDGGQAEGEDERQDQKDSADQVG